MYLHIQHTWNGKTIGADEAVHVHLTPHPAGLRLQIDAPHHHDPLPPHPSGTVPGLWNYEVVEVFVAGTRDPVPYLEVEVGPGGHHLVLQLSGVRNAVASGLPLDLTITSAGPRWRAEALIPHELLPAGPWTINATAIHGIGDARRYLSAVPLPGPAPDFHQPGVFVPFTPTPSPRRAS